MRVEIEVKRIDVHPGVAANAHIIVGNCAADQAADGWEMTGILPYNGLIYVYFKRVRREAS